MPESDTLICRTSIVSSYLTETIPSHESLARYRSNELKE
jgi:hypothetical protein